MEFASKGYFLLLLLLIPYILWYFLYRRKNEPTMRMSDTKQYLYAPKSLRVRLIHLPMFLRCVSFVLIVCAMARPQTHNSWDNKTVEGINIMLAMDVSTSMLAEDLKPNRMEAAKDVAHEFISGRPNDNIGLTIFAGEAFTQCPMTTDHSSLLRLLQDTRTDIAARARPLPYLRCCYRKALYHGVVSRPPCHELCQFLCRMLLFDVDFHHTEGQLPFHKHLNIQVV